MAYIFLLTAILLNLVKSFCSKRISGRVSGLSDTVDVTLVRNILCALLGVMIIFMGGTEGFFMPPIGWIICTVSGIAIGANYVVWVLSLRSGVYLLTSTANSANFIVAVFCAVVFFKESLPLPKILAIVFILLAIFFMGKYQTESQGKPKPLHILLLFLVFLTAGVSSVTQKWFTRTLPEISAHTFTFYSLLVSVVLLTIFSTVLPHKPTFKARTKSLSASIIWIVIMAIAFYGVTYFQTGASALLDAVVMYPMYNGLTLAGGCLMAWFCFKEKPSRNSVIGIILVFIAIMLQTL
jgi:drug/metabolite transporter (DMT)-like permease